MAARRKILKGIPISSGIVLGTTKVLLPGDLRVAEKPVAVSEVQGEIDALERAIQETMTELRQLRDSAGKKIGGPVAKIFDAQLLMAADSDFLARVKDEIAAQKRNAGYVYSSLVRQTTLPLKRSSDPYLRQMSQDIEAVSNRVISHLSGYLEKSTIEFPAGTIIVSRSFTPGEIMEFRNRRAAGFVAGKGGRSSHAALIARSLMTPMAVVNNCWREISDGSRIILDGTNGVAIVNPSSDEWAEFQKKKRRQGPGTVTRIKKLTDLPPHTADGVAVNIAANLELPGPADEVLAQQKIPVGLYRTEFLYLENDDFPDEEMQYRFYRRVGEAFPHSTVTLRTFDLGADKMKGDGLLPTEDNPALGWRGIRSMLELPEIFKAQIRAMLRASAEADFRIMLPMISDVTELEAAKKLISQVKLELRRKKIPMAEDIPIGIMIEVPSAALTADELAQKCDFFSIGTNDLTQYTLSADRNNARVANLYNALHPSVLNLVQMTIEAGERHKIPVAICGEIASDLLALPLLIGMNVSQLSMNPARIFDACRLVAKIDTGFLPGLVQSVLAARNVEQIRKALESYRDGLNKRKRSR